MPFDRDGRLAYRGRLDDSGPGSGRSPTGRDLRRALEVTLSGEPVDSPEQPSIGCSIKWSAGNEPGYASSAVAEAGRGGGPSPSSRT